MSTVALRVTGLGSYYATEQQELGPFTALQEQDPNFDVQLAEQLQVEPKQIVAARLQETLPSLEPKSIIELRDSYMRWLAIKEDIDVLDVIFAAILDRRVVGDPLWLFVVAPPGSTKTEIMRSLFDLPDVYHLSQLTSKTIVSGKEKKDGTVVRGIYSKINGKVLVIPELSQILCKSHDERDAIFAQFRDLYDGHCVYGYGTIDTPITVDCRIGLLAGVTSAIDMYGTVHAVLGDRFLKIRPKFNRDLARDRAIQNKEQLEQMRRELAQAARYFFHHVELSKLPVFTEGQLSKIGLYAEFVSQIRTTVTSQAFREYDTSEWQPEAEFATRLAQQFRKLAESVALLRNHAEITPEDMAAVSRVAMDTCLPNRLKIVRTLYYAEDLLSIADTAKQSELSYWKTRNSLEALAVIGGILEEVGSEKQHNERYYKLTNQFRQLMDQVLKP